MTDIPDNADLTGAAVTQGDFKSALEQFLDAVRERLVSGSTAITSFLSTGMADGCTAAFLTVTNATLRLGQSGTDVSVYHRAGDDRFVRLHGGSSSSTSGGGIKLFGGSHATQADDVSIHNGSTEAWRFTDAGPMRPGADGNRDIGTASFRVRDLFVVNSPTVGSSEKIKEDIQDLPAGPDGLGLAFQRLLRPRIFRLIGGTSGRFHGGFIAEEVEEAIVAHGYTTQQVAAFVRAPLVDTNGQALIDPETGEQAQGLGLRYEELIASLTLAVQEEADAREALEARVAALEAA